MDFEAENVCVYCGKCMPCPVGINIPLVNRLYDLAAGGDEEGREQYSRLEKKASTCIGCGHCNFCCPEGVYQSERMDEIRKYFGE